MRSNAEFLRGQFSALGLDVGLRCILPRRSPTAEALEAMGSPPRRRPDGWGPSPAWWFASGASRGRLLANTNARAPDCVSPSPSTVGLMAKQQGVTTEDRAKVVRVALAGIAGGVELGEIAARLPPLHPNPQRHLSGGLAPRDRVVTGHPVPGFI